MSSHYGAAHSIDGVMVFDGATTPPIVSHTTTSRRTPPAPFRSRNPDLNRLQPFQYPHLQAAFARASQQIDAAAAPPHYSGYTMPAYQSAVDRVPYRIRNQSRPQYFTQDTVEEQRRLVRVTASPVSPALVITIAAPAPSGSRRNQHQSHYPEEDDELMAAEAASVDEYQIRTIGASDSAIEKLERLETFDGDDCCTICLEEMNSCSSDAAGRRVIRLDCKHVFHENCLVPWIHNSNCCPLCRFQITD